MSRSDDAISNLIVKEIYRRKTSSTFWLDPDLLARIRAAGKSKNTSTSAIVNDALLAAFPAPGVAAQPQAAATIDKLEEK